MGIPFLIYPWGVGLTVLRRSFSADMLSREILNFIYSELFSYQFSSSSLEDFSSYLEMRLVEAGVRADITGIGVFGRLLVFEILVDGEVGVFSVSLNPALADAPGSEDSLESEFFSRCGVSRLTSLGSVFSRV